MDDDVLDPQAKLPMSMKLVLKIALTGEPMRRLFRRAIITMLSVAAMTLPPAVAQQQASTITLSCDGTSKLTATAAADLKPDPVTKLGIIVNLVARTVTFMNFVLPIKQYSETLVNFSGRSKGPLPSEINGSIDRVTGYTDINFWYENVGNNSEWELACRPTTRLF
jgi:hypothetical protein